MSESLSYSEFNSLPEDLKKEVMDFIAFLKQKKSKRKKVTKREFGVLKGKIKMSDDFDEPLDDFKQYME